jgi:hypothetical protein
VTRANRPSLRSAALLLCLGVAACAGTGSPSGPGATTPPAAGTGGGARGGATTAAARAAPDPDAPNPSADPVTQARADCWMKVETQPALRGIDQRIGFVDKCVAEQLKGGPRP